MLYEVAILEVPTREQEKAGQAEKLIFGPAPVVASDDRNASISVVIDNADKFANVAKDRMKVLIRPFVC